jgi:VWFA-related protein
MRALLPAAAVLTCAAAAAAPGSLRLQAQSSGSVRSQAVFTTEAELVVLHLLVKDRRGAFVCELSPDAFTIIEDGRPQRVQVFTGEDAPATIGLVIDASGSMLSARDLIIAAVTSFAESSNPQDELFALAFNERVRFALPSGTLFTSDPSLLRRALLGTVWTRGRTALYDAIAQGLDRVAKGSHDRKVLIVIGDGGDNASTTTFDDVVARTQASNTVVFTIALSDPVDRDVNPGRLRKIAEPTGGEAFAPRTTTEIGDVLQHIANDIRHGYTIGYVPAAAAKDGAFHRIRVVARSPDGRRLVVRTRAGYLASGGG